jgi:hypothetical protein
MKSSFLDSLFNLARGGAPARERITATFRASDSVRVKKRDDGRLSVMMGRDDARVLFEILSELFAETKKNDK